MGAYISISFPLLFLAVVVQSSFVPQVRVLGGGPDLVLLLVLTWASDAELDEALVWAFVGGIMQDLLSAAPTGAHTLGMIPTIAAVYFLGQQVYRVGPLLMLVVLFAGTFVKETVLWLVMTLASYQNDPLNLVSNVILPSAMYNVAAGIPVYVVVRWIQRRSRRSRVF
jgi:rod shape-determining protein MreD